MKKFVFLFLLASFLFIFPTKSFAAIREVEQVEQALESYKSEGNTSLEKFLEDSAKINMAVGVKSLVGSRDSDGNTTEGALQSSMKLIGGLYSNPPASTQIYVADLMHNMNIAQPAYAQGLGFSSLSPILSGWKVFRNIAYLFFVLIFLVIGFLIMLRKKVGQAAVTAQQAIPKIIVAMLAVTFSYAIAGFLIDLMYLVMYMMLGLFQSQTNGQLSVNQSIWELGKEIVNSTMGDGADVIGEFVTSLLDDEVGGAIATGFSWITQVTGALIFAVAAVYAVVKLFFELLKTYVTILISILMSPLLLMFEAIPGQSHFGKWVKGLIGNLAAFPTVFLVIILYKLLVASTNTSTGFMPPFLLNGFATPAAVNFLIGIGLLLGMPEAVKQVKKLLGAADGGIFGTVLKSGASTAGKAMDLSMPAAGAGISGVAGAARGGFAAAKNRGSARDIMSGMMKGYSPDSINVTGGFAPRAKVGWKTGSSARKYIDRAKDGRLFDPESIEGQLAKLAGQQKKTEKEKAPPTVHNPS